jgi:polyphosphate kinase
MPTDDTASGHHEPSPDLELDSPENFLDRELSLLEFNSRVLELALDSSVPLLERLRFLTICSSNMDEFFEVRVFGLKQRIAFDSAIPQTPGLPRQEIFKRLSKRAHELVAAQYEALQRKILPALESEGIRVLECPDWTPEQNQWVRAYFEKEVLPVLTPIGLDPAHPFPRITNKSLNFVVSLKGKDAFGRSSRAAVVQAPRMLPRLIMFPAEISALRYEFFLLSSVIQKNVEELFPGMKITGCHQFRVTRNSDLWVDEEEVEDLLLALKDELPGRRFGGASRLELAENCSEEMSAFLLEEFRLGPDDLYQATGPVNLHRLSALYDKVDRPDLKYRPFLAGGTAPLRTEVSLLKRVRQNDILLHHPYQTFATVVELLRTAAHDPDVLAIKQTVYRTEPDSPLVDALLDAARAGKEVTAVVELRARFDEAANIDLATRLQEAGANVVYGVVGYKTHCKMILIVRREGDTLRRYVHLGTGNYHSGTARAYTDLGIITCDEKITEDVHHVFQQLTGLGKVKELQKLLQSPFTLHKTLLELIDFEIARVQGGGKGRIMAKMNSLVEANVIKALYRASRAGVEIDLIVRGICCLRPGVAGLSENIRVLSILGRFLEHPRIFYFHHGGEHVTYCGSADWMPRNFFSRVEICFPIESKKLRKRILDEALLTYLRDNKNAWELQADGRYRRVTPAAGEEALSAQENLLEALTDTPHHHP